MVASRQLKTTFWLVCANTCGDFNVEKKTNSNKKTVRTNLFITNHFITSLLRCQFRIGCFEHFVAYKHL